MISSLPHLVGLLPRVYYTLTNFRGGGKAPLAPPLNTPMPPPYYPKSNGQTPSLRMQSTRVPHYNEDWTGLFEVVSSKKAVVVLLIYLQEAMYNKSVDENTTNQ